MQLDPVDRTKITDVSGQRFGRLVVIEPAGARRYRKGMALYFRCLCDCGTEILAQRSNLQNGTRSCGCDHRISRGTVGKAGIAHPLYVVWKKMIERCFSPSCPDYENYGGRGIAICARWLQGDGDQGGLDCFVADMGQRPFRGATIERRNNSLGYGPDNCFWASMTAQGRNKRNNRIIVSNGESLPVSVWAERTSIPYFTLIRRLNAGWDHERIVTEPVHYRGQRL